MADLQTYPVSPKFWRSAKRKGWDEFTKNLAGYLLYSEHRNLEGLYCLPKPYAMADLGWTAEQLDHPWQVLLLDGFFMYDEDAEVVLLPKALMYRSPNTENHMKGALNALSLVPDTVLWASFLTSARDYAPKFFDFLGGEAELQKYTVHNQSINPSEWVASDRKEAA